MIIEIIKILSAIKNRIGSKERDASIIVQSLLKSANTPFLVQTFPSQTPKFLAAELLADDRLVPCVPSGLRSGEITDADAVVSSLTSSQLFIDTPNINFNPRTDTICVCNYYFAPSLAVSRASIPLLMHARSVRGVLNVQPENYTSENILVGNARSPVSIVFAHYDAYFSGATDNASGVATVLEVVRRNPQLLKMTLFVFAGNEELSYDYPVYWGRGFREFYRMNPRLLDNATAMYVVDSVGDGPPVVEKKQQVMQLAFPLGPYPKLYEKTSLITGDFDALMSVYHGPDDLPQRLDEKHLESTVILLERLLSSAR